jgi:hypothetical protein
LDGTDPAMAVGGSTLQYGVTPIPVGKSLTLKALAVKAGLLPSPIMTEVYVYTPPLAVKKAWYLDNTPDGKIETVIIDFEKDLPIIPDRLAFKINDQRGKTDDRTAVGPEISFAGGSKSRIIVTLSNPFMFGITSVANQSVSGHIFRQDNIPTLELDFPVDDSVPPVNFAATVSEPDSAHPLKHIGITLSETVDLPIGSQTVFVFKHGSKELASGDVKIHHIEKVGDWDYQIYIDSTSNLFPIVGDSVAIRADGEVKDVAKNTPKTAIFIRLGGIVPKAKPVDIYVTFPNSTKDKASDGLEPQGQTLFIPVDKGGNALVGKAEDGKCQSQCFTGDLGKFVGPVFHIVTPGAVQYKLKIFNNFGEFVAEGSGRFTDGDLEQMQRNNGPTGVKYVARVVWTGHAYDGRKAATGAYILQAILITDTDSKTGAPPATVTKRITFGLLRSLRGS